MNKNALKPDYFPKSKGALATSPDDLLLTDEAAAYLRLSTSTLNKMRLYGKGPEFCRLGRAIRYMRRDLDRFRDAGKGTVSSRSVEG